MNKAIFRRLAALQQIAEKNKPFRVKVLFANGSEATTDQSGALDLLQELGPCGEIESFQTDNPAYSGWAQLLTILLNPLPNREVTDFET